LIYVLAVITAQPGQREKILDAFHANSPTVRAEAGCIEYRAAVDAEDALPMQTPYGEDTFVVVEKWQDMECLRAHSTAPHMAAYSAATKGWVASRTIHILSPVPAES
jgi:quinol monooxygenase YgiN